MPATLLLTAEERRMLTGYKRPSKQVEVLQASGKDRLVAHQEPPAPRILGPIRPAADGNVA